MPATTFLVAREDIVRPLGAVPAATTTNITTNTSVVSTALQDDFPVDGTFIGWFVILLQDSDGSTSTNNGVIRRVTAYTASSGTLTVAGAALGAEDEATDFLLTRFNPARVLDWFNRVRQNLFPDIAIIRDHQPLVTGQVQRRFKLPTTLRDAPISVSIGEWPSAAAMAENEITDPGFENWTSATTPASWTVAGSGSTVNQEEQTTSPANYAVFRDANSARILNNASDTTTLLQTVTPAVAAQRQVASMGLAVYNTQTSVNVALSIVAALTGASALHGGTGWEILTGQATLAEVTTVAVGVSIPQATAFSIFVDEAILIIGQSEGIVPTWEPLLRWDWVPSVAGASDNGFLEFPYDLPTHHVLRIASRDLLSSITSDTSTFEVDGELLEPVYDAVRAELCGEAANLSVDDKDERKWRGLEGFYRGRSEQGQQKRFISVPRPQLTIPDFSYGASGRATRRTIRR
jgi:hypothetical protein